MSYLYFIIPGVVVLGIIILLLLKRPKKIEKAIDISGITEILDKTNIKKVEFIRNKIVLHTHDIKRFDVETLHQKGALGVNIIGDKIKFYFDGGDQKNKQMFEVIQDYIER